MGVLTQLSACSSMLFFLFNNVTIHNEGVYIPFPSCALKLSNLHIQFYLLALTTLNAFYLLRMRENRSRSVYILQVRFFLMTSFKIAHQLQGNFKICAGACPTVFCFRAGSLDVGDAPASSRQKKESSQKGLDVSPISDTK
jgi:hypothetical protein